MIVYKKFWRCSHLYKTLEEEKAYLEDTLKQFQEIISNTELRLSAIPRMHRDNPVLLESLLKQYGHRLEMLKRTEKKPYFARIDFKNSDDQTPVECYIGKVGVHDDDNKLITVDWRAPIASVYYDSNIGETSYQAPKGVVTGELLLKRQYDIENGILNSYQDVDTVSNDEILRPYLGTNVDNRLKNIVSTIQSEQNDIIRQPLLKNLIIQGVAGSGKTTVALHRIAYLVYNNMDSINPDQYLVIGPNKFFVNYISSVLPDLDVDNVAQLTYDEILKELLQESIDIVPDEDKLIESISNPEKLIFEKVRVSMAFKRALDQFLNDLDKDIIPNKDFEIKGYTIIPQNVIRKIYSEIDNGIINYDILSKKIERAILLLGKYIEDNYEEIRTSIHETFRNNVKNMSREELEKERKNIAYLEKELRNNCRQSLKKYFSKANPKILNLYIAFLKDINKYLKIENYDFVNYAKNVISNIKRKKVEFEDVASLVYLYYRIYGSQDFAKYRHTVIDEAQDFGEFNFYALKKLLGNSTFSIFGDLAQSIYQYRGIDNWEKVIYSTFESKCDIKYLSKSYRTTTEIMESANNITDYLGLNIAEPVIRHGVDVGYTKIENDAFSSIINYINDYISKGFQSIAIICKDENESLLINNNLKLAGINATNITSSDTEYKGGICTITSYLSKGLEFDGVIIANASENIYKSNLPIDMKLLYVSMTRALHELQILYTDEISLPLKNDLKKKSDMSLVRKK